jgi:Tol biopolymer transport system component
MQNLLIGCLFCVFYFQSIGQTAILSFAEPSISPKGDDIAFVSGGDIWTVSSKGSAAHLLVSNPATESRPLYSPDGKRLAFTSTRTGNGDVYVLNLETGAVKRLTYDDGGEQVSGWSRDGQRVFFHGTMQDIAGMNDMSTSFLLRLRPMVPLWHFRREALLLISGGAMVEAILTRRKFG